MPASSTAEINEAFSEVIAPKKRKMDDLYRNEKKKKKKKVSKDEEFFIPYAAADQHTEEGLVNFKVYLNLRFPLNNLHFSLLILGWL